MIKGNQAMKGIVFLLKASLGSLGTGRLGLYEIYKAFDPKSGGFLMVMRRLGMVLGL